MVRFIARRLVLAVSVLALTSAFIRPAQACTGITLRARDGAVVYGRTMEWGTFDLHSRVSVIPRGLAFTGATPDKQPGMRWTAKYGVVALDGVGKDIVLDGMNEKGLTAGIFYHPGFAEYPAYDPAKAAKTIGPTDLGTFLLTTCATVEEVRTAVSDVLVAPVVEEAIGIAPPVHLLVTEPSGKAIVVEFTKGKTVIHEAPLGVITNAPNYDWHNINLRNYVNLSPVAIPDKQLDGDTFKALGGGSGMIGLPGDFTPPSRFVRAVAFSQTARPTATGDETVYELFRILDNFNVPLGSAEGSGDDKTKGMRSSTIWTTAHDTKNLVLYYHTAHNRRVRMVDLKKIDFGASKEIQRMPLDRVPEQDIEDVTPR
ncbi:MAG: choloylglycine hydrolase family protein [Phycisphaerales bacterium]